MKHELSKERLEEIAAHEIGSDAYPRRAEWQAMASALLAAHEQEPVAYISYYESGLNHGVCQKDDTVKMEWLKRGFSVQPLYTHPTPELIAIVDRLNLSGYEHEDGEVTPQNSAAVVDILLQQLDEVVQGRDTHPAPSIPAAVPEDLLSLMEEVLRISDRDHDAWNRAKSAIAACRAAMLQSDDGRDYRGIVERIAEIMHGSVTDVDLLTVTVLSMKQKTEHAALPDGYCVMPCKLSAENGAKSALSGEFHVTHRIVCQSCGGEACEDCNEEGGWDGEILIGWDIIKQIHEASVEACALPVAPKGV